MPRHLVFSEEAATDFRPERIKTVPHLRNLSKINLLAGPNNSGKSRILRKVLTQGHTPIYCAIDKEAAAIEQFRGLRNQDILRKEIIDQL